MFKFIPHPRDGNLYDIYGMGGSWGPLRILTTQLPPRPRVWLRRGGAAASGLSRAAFPTFLSREPSVQVG